MQIYKNWLRRNNTPYQETPFGLLFKYQGGGFIIADNSNDSDYFQLIMPAIADVKGNIFGVLKAANIVNREIKCVKCTITDDNENVWLATRVFSLMFRKHHSKTPEILIKTRA